MAENRKLNPENRDRETEATTQVSEGKNCTWNFQPSIQIYLNNNQLMDEGGGRGEPKAEDDTEEDRPIPETPLPDSPLQKPIPESQVAADSSFSWPRKIRVTVEFD